MAYSVPNLYQPRVAPDTTGSSAGIAAAGDAIAGVLATIASNKREDEIRAEDRQHQLEDREALFQRQDQVYMRRREDQLEDRSALFGRQDMIRGEERSYAERQKEEERQRELAASAGGVAAMTAMGLLSPEQAAVFDSAPDNQKGKIGDVLLRMGGMRAAEMADERAREQSRQASPLVDPVTGQTDQNFYHFNGQMVPRHPNEPSAALFPEEVSAPAGFDVDGIDIGPDGRVRSARLRRPDPVPSSGLYPQDSGGGVFTDPELDL